MKITVKDNPIPKDWTCGDFLQDSNKLIYKIFHVGPGEYCLSSISSGETVAKGFLHEINERFNNINSGWEKLTGKTITIEV